MLHCQIIILLHCCIISQQFVFFFQEEDSSFPSFMKMSSSSNSISKMKAPSSTSISSVGMSSAPSRTRESVVTLNYSGARSSSELTLIESNVPKKRKLWIFVFFNQLFYIYQLLRQEVEKSDFVPTDQFLTPSLKFELLLTALTETGNLNQWKKRQVNIHDGALSPVLQFLRKSSSNCISLGTWSRKCVKHWNLQNVLGNLQTSLGVVGLSSKS